MSRPLYITLYSTLFGVAAATQCYMMNGEPATNDFQPCNNILSGGNQSACCNLGKSPSDICLGSGLCQRQDASDSDFLIYAVGCTDPSGKDPSCPQYCSSGSVMYSFELCGNGLWCCNNQDTATCCKNGQGDFSFDLTSLGTTVYATSPATMTTTVVAKPTGSQYQAAIKNARNQTVIVGSSVGAALGAMLLGSLVLLCCAVRRLKKQRQLSRQEHGRPEILTSVPRRRPFEHRKMEVQPWHFRSEVEAGRVMPPELGVTTVAKTELDGEPVERFNT